MSKRALVLAFVLISGTAAFAEDAPPKSDDKKEASKSEQKFANPIPGKCPVMPEEDADPEIKTEVDGKTYCFCCNKCLRVFLVHPDRYVKPAAKDAKKEEKKDDKKDEKKDK